MFAIVGLGNPGDKYRDTRHNVGYMAVDLLARNHNIDINRMKYSSLIGEGRIEGHKVILVKPQTFMNLSGEAVLAVRDFYKLENSHIIIIYDDIDIDLGRIRVRREGSAGSHNGMRSIIQLIKEQDFPRIRIGIGSAPDYMELSDYVLSRFYKSELEDINDAIKKGAYAAELIITKGVSHAMNAVNGG
ncbi:MAG: aminoacyl-tRNA hydrolase [Clostridiales bacterium]|nr:aminoacyl-tRNA hydrolase [Clostridiales bacterium]